MRKLFVALMISLVLLVASVSMIVFCSGNHVISASANGGGC
jgi:hypothetical protein